MFYASGDYYEGDWDANMKDGRGEQIYSNG